MIAGFGLTLLLLSLISGFSGWNAFRFMQSANRAARTQQIVTELEAFMSELKDAETGQRGYIITAKDSYLEPYYATVGRLDVHLDTLQQLMADNPSQLQQLATLRPLTTRKVAELRETIAIRRAQGFAAALKRIDSDEGKRLMDNIRQGIQVIQADETLRLQQRTLQTTKSAQLLTLVVVLGSLSAIALVPAAVLIINQDIYRRKQAEQALRQSEMALHQTNQRLVEQVSELEQRHKATALFNQMSDLFQTCLTFEEACTVIAQTVPEFFPAVSGGIFLTNASRNLVEVAVSWGETSHGQPLFALDECLALRRGQPHYNQHNHQGLRCSHLRSTFTGECFCIPMLAQGDAIGVLQLQTTGQNTLTEAQQAVAVAIAKQISLALANLKLRDILQTQSIRDPLTGLYNRRYLEEFLLRELHRAQRNQQSIGVIMVDVDHFKRFNDTFGHEAGDAVLRELGLFLRTNIRSSDIACRYGGEELTLILPDATLAETCNRAEALREGVKHLSVQHRRQPLTAISISLGVACFPLHGTTGDAVLQAADMALYRAKAEGRDRVVTA